MSGERRNKELVRRITEAIWNGGELEKIPDYYSDSYVSDYAPYAPPAKGIAGVRAMIERAHATLSNYHEEVVDMIAEDNRVAVRLTISGVQTGAWGPIPPTGKAVSYDEIVVLTFHEGKVVHQRGLVDNLLALRQLGVVPTPRESA